jgi:putative endonuclease
MQSTDQQGKRDRRHAAGVAGEIAVRQYVQRMGWHIVDHNVRWREGELDLIAVDGATLVVAEVKTLVGRGPEGRASFSPFESIGRRKQNQIRMLTRRWLTDELRRTRAAEGVRFSDLRFDAFAVVLSRAGDVTEIQHLEDAF